MPLDTGGVTQLHVLAGTDHDDAPNGADTPTLDYGPDVGAALKALREFQGLSLQDVSDATRIRRAYLQAVEDMRIEELPSRPFALGYVRAYAKVLGLDPEDAVQRFKQDAPEADEVLRAPVGVRRQGDPRLGTVVAGGVLIVAAIVLWNVAQRAISDTAPPPISPAEQAAAGVPAGSAHGPTGPISLGAPVAAPPEATIPDPYKTPGLEAASAADGSADAAAKAAKERAVAAAAEPEDVSRHGTPFQARGKIYGDAAAGGPVVLQATRNAQLVIHGADGKTVLFAQSLVAGEAYRAPNIKGLSVDVSDPTAFEVYVGGLMAGRLPATVTPLSKLGG